MPTHFWGDEDFDWKGLDDCCRIVKNICTNYGRLGIHVKEKYGTLRAYTYFWPGDLHSLIFPGYVYCQYKDKWFGLGNLLWSCDVYVFPKICKYTGLLKLAHWYQKKIYNYAYQKALKKHPHLKDEILCDADFPELIKGAEEVQDKYWTRLD